MTLREEIVKLRNDLRKEATQIAIMRSLEATVTANVKRDTAQRSNDILNKYPETP